MSQLALLGLPIGNLDDLSIRALKTLFSSDVILAEDTRNYLKIKNIAKERYPVVLNHLGVDKDVKPELLSYREQNHARITPKIIELLRQNKTVTLVSDAGMPSISDPGYRLVDAVLQEGFNVDVIPGPSAVDTALVISGLPTDKFSFVGFLPREKGKIKKVLEPFLHLPTTVILYESPYRVVRTLEILAELAPELYVAACNDLTKKFQKVYRGEVQEVNAEIQKNKIVGEWVLVLRKVAS